MSEDPKTWLRRLGFGGADARPKAATNKVPLHWGRASWEEKAQENPLFAIMTTAGMSDAAPSEFSAEQLDAFFAKGRKLFHRHLKPVLKAELPPGDDTLIVEYGCGAGRMLRSVVDAGYRCVGIDISETMLAHCRRLVPDVEGLSLLDAAGRCQLPNEAASLVYSYAVVQHIALLSRFETAIDEMCRVLRPGGILLLHVNCQDFANGDLQRPGRTENHENHSLHFGEGGRMPLLRHDQDNWSGVYIGESRLTGMLAERQVTLERWYYHSAAKLRSVWAVARKNGGR